MVYPYLVHLEVHDKQPPLADPEQHFEGRDPKTLVDDVFLLMSPKFLVLEEGVQEFSQLVTYFVFLSKPSNSMKNAIFSYFG